MPLPHGVQRLIHTDNLGDLNNEHRLELQALTPDPFFLLRLLGTLLVTLYPVIHQALGLDSKWFRPRSRGLKNLISFAGGATIMVAYFHILNSGKLQLSGPLDNNDMASIGLCVFGTIVYSALDLVLHCRVQHGTEYILESNLPGDKPIAQVESSKPRVPPSAFGVEVADTPSTDALQRPSEHSDSIALHSILMGIAIVADPQPRTLLMIALFREILRCAEPVHFVNRQGFITLIILLFTVSLRAALLPAALALYQHTDGAVALMETLEISNKAVCTAVGCIRCLIGGPLIYMTFAEFFSLEFEKSNSDDLERAKGIPYSAWIHLSAGLVVTFVVDSMLQ